ncbi:hypothetical protein ACMHYJ_05385 [Castellaniella hirudinis]|uniref:hypothetical protein n=1 Tax=Castellaniella hirudinis TaxID=1144617 RepID=UPI0039C0AE38
MKQADLTALALRKIYHAEQLGMDAETVKQMRDTVADLNGQLDHAETYIEHETAMLNTDERVAVFDGEWDKFFIALAKLGLMASDWTRKRIAAPGGLRAGGV